MPTRLLGKCSDSLGSSDHEVVKVVVHTADTSAIDDLEANEAILAPGAPGVLDVPDATNLCSGSWGARGAALVAIEGETISASSSKLILSCVSADGVGGWDSNFSTGLEADKDDSVVDGSGAASVSHNNTTRVVAPDSVASREGDGERSHLELGVHVAERVGDSSVAASTGAVSSLDTLVEACAAVRGLVRVGGVEVGTVCVPGEVPVGSGPATLASISGVDTVNTFLLGDSLGSDKDSSIFGGLLDGYHSLEDNGGVEDPA